MAGIQHYANDFGDDDVSDDMEIEDESETRPHALRVANDSSDAVSDEDDFDEDDREGASLEDASTLLGLRNAAPSSGMPPSALVNLPRF